MSSFNDALTNKYVLFLGLFLLSGCVHYGDSAASDTIALEVPVLHVELASIDVDEIVFDTHCVGENWDTGEFTEWSGELQWAWSTGERRIYSFVDRSVEYRYDVPVLDAFSIERTAFDAKYRLGNVSEYSCRFKIDEEYNITYSNQTDEIISFYEKYRAECRYDRERGYHDCRADNEYPGDVIDRVVYAAYDGGSR